MFIWTVFTEGK